jgi:Domain of unknown function (DUF4062)
MSESKVYKVFISSTMRDLQQERKLVYSKLKEYNIQPIWAEQFHDNLKTSERIIEEKLLEADGYLGIFDRYYGQIPKENNPNKISVSNIEHDIAKKSFLPKLIFTSRIKPGEKRDPSDVDGKLEKFLEEVGDYNKGNWINFYVDREELGKILEDRLPQFKDDLENGGLPYELRKGIVKTPMDLSIANKNTDWYLHQGSNDYFLVLPKIFGDMQSIILDLISRNKSIIITGRHGIGKSIFT